jgi:hypothetical protein
MKLCSICLVPAVLVTPLNCGHEICVRCLLGYLGNLIAQAKVASISCPFGDCDFVFMEDDVKKHVPTE